jgi:hypothetical protein
MAVRPGLNAKSLNCIDLAWDRRPTNVPSLWIPEVWAFGPPGARLNVKEPVGWREEDGGVCCVRQDVSYESWSFEWQGRVEAQDDAVTIEVSIANTGHEPLPEPFHFSACFNFLTAPDFMNSTGSRSYFLTRDGWQNMLPFRRPQAQRRGHDPYHVFLEGREDPGDGEVVSGPRAVSPLCVRVNRTHDACVGYAWQRALRLDFNYNRLHCMHSTPAFGPLGAGATSTHRGMIMFHEGDKELLLERFREKGMA